MSKETRRKLLKGIAVTLPAAWVTPVIKSVALPAHAQTTSCEAPEGCYVQSGQITASFYWPGGTGPHPVVVYENAICEGPVQDVLYDGPFVLAMDQAQAAILLSCTREVNPIPFLTPPPPSGCNFYGCFGQGQD